MLFVSEDSTTHPHAVPERTWRASSDSGGVRPLGPADGAKEASDQTIRELIGRRKQLIDIHTTERHRAARSSVFHVEDSIRSVLAFIEDRIRDIEGQIDQAIRQDPVWSEKDQLLQTVPGIDENLSKQLLIELPELGSLAGRQIASYVGVAPQGRNGEPTKNGPRSRGGSPVVRGVLHSATMGVMQHDHKMQAFYDRLRAAGKPENVAVMACMRKMLVILNTIIKGRTVYDTGRE
jgi:transposase